jgi:hypothetical protein
VAAEQVKVQVLAPVAVWVYSVRDCRESVQLQEVTLGQEVLDQVEV